MKKLMDKIGRISFIILVALAIWNGLGSFLSRNMKAAPDDYTAKVKTGGEIEAKYLAAGPHEVAYLESGTLSSLEKFEICYPKDLDTMGRAPVVIYLNGTGTKGSKYPALQKHMASWGFITVANEEANSFYGEGAELSIRCLKLADSFDQDGPAIPLKGHIDFDNIGVAGHSQGGIGVINAATLHPASGLVKAAVILSSAETDAARALLWDPDASKVRAHTLLIGSTGSTDAKLASLEDLNATFDKIKGPGRAMARRNDADHGQMLYYADGYVTAWFRYFLQGDKDADAFFGKDPELGRNGLYQDFRAVAPDLK